MTATITTPLLVNANSLHIPLADKSVHCVATSPPYWGLRDYGTATWEGGDPECDHAAAQIRTGLGLAALEEKYRGKCQKCGAIRLDEQLGLEPLHDCLAWASGYANVEKLVAAALHVIEQGDLDAEAKLVHVAALLREIPAVMTHPSEPCGRCFVCQMRQFAVEMWRVLRDDGVFWLNLGDGYVGGGGYSPDSPVNVQRREQGSGIDGAFHFRERTHDRQMVGKPAVNSGLKAKNLVGVPWRVALALQADGWILRSDVVWAKGNPLPESVTDRPTKAHEYVFLLAKSGKYFYDHIAIKERVQESSIKRIMQTTFDEQMGGEKDYRNGTNTNRSMRQTLENFRSSASRSKEEGDWDLATRNRRTVWSVASYAYSGAHFATWPPDLVEPMIKAGTSEAGCCPECGTPWKRIVSKGDPRPRPDNPNPVLPYTAESNHRQGIDGSTLHMTRQTVTLGWEPGCKCQMIYPCEHCSETGGDCLVCDGKGRVAAALSPIPCTVLDPFAGSGTTLMVARKLGRRSVGLDLSFAYLKDQARPRLSLDDLDNFERGRTHKVADTLTDDLPLFQMATNLT